MLLIPRHGRKETRSVLNTQTGDWDCCINCLCGTSVNESLGSVSLLFGKCAPTARRSLRRKGEQQMKNFFKDLDASISQLRALLARNDIEPDQKENVEHALKELKRLRREPHYKQVNIYRCVREVTERLLRAFVKR
jgi:predicted PP-loop superfamily ATPase